MMTAKWITVYILLFWSLIITFAINADILQILYAFIAEYFLFYDDILYLN